MTRSLTLGALITTINRKYYLRGLNSFTTTVTSTSHPAPTATFTDVGYYLSWINETLFSLRNESEFDPGCVSFDIDGHVLDGQWKGTLTIPPNPKSIIGIFIELETSALSLEVNFWQIYFVTVRTETIFFSF